MRRIGLRRVAGWATSERLLARRTRRPAGSSRRFWSRIEEDDPFLPRPPGPRRPEAEVPAAFASRDPSPKPTPPPKENPKPKPPAPAPAVDRTPPRIAPPQRPPSGGRVPATPVRSEATVQRALVDRTGRGSAEVRKEREEARRGPQLPPSRSVDDYLGILGELAASERVYRESRTSLDDLFGGAQEGRVPLGKRSPAKPWDDS